jgi:hypothetical protein
MGKILASEAGAALDTDLMTGGGTDDTAALQAVLDRARDGDPVHLVLDGPALVSGLDIHGNTTIEGTAGAGLYLADGSERAVIRNANRTRDEVVDEQIAIRGIFVNGNRAGQVEASDWQGVQREYRVPQIDREGALKTAIEFMGVNHLRIEGVTVWNARSYGIWIATAIDVQIRDVVIDANFGLYPGTETPEAQRAYLDGFRSNLDGIHINGPSRHVLIENVRLRCEDDSIALNANDAFSDDMTIANECGPYVGQGPITDVVIRNVVFDDTIQGFRFLSGDQRIDRVLVENVSGTIRHQMVLLSNFYHSSPGNFGSIVIRNMNLDPLPSATWREMYPDWLDTFGNDGEADGQVDLPFFSLRARIEHLELDGVSGHLVDSRPLLRLGKNADIGTLRARFVVDDPDGVVDPLMLVAGSRIRNLQLSVARRP